MERWAKKVAIVTGASAGIGAATSEALVKHGVTVVGFARRVELIEALAKKINPAGPGKLYAVQADMSQEDDILKAFKWVSENVGPVHILINNAGLVQNTSLHDGETAKWKKVFDVNVLGLCIATREAVRIMKANGINDGHIVHINSIAGHNVFDLPNMNVYAASKHAVTALTETLRLELNRLGSKIRITSVSPGAVSTEILEVNNLTLDEDLRSKEEDNLKSEDIANAILYVLSTPPHVQVHELIIKPVGEPI